MSGASHSVAALTATGLCVRHRLDGRLLVDNVDLFAATGEVTCLVGESGSGKTLTTRALLGITPPELVVEMRRFEVAGSPERPRDRLAFVPQRAMSALNPLLRIDTQLTECASPAIRSGVDGASRAAVRLLHEVGIDAPERRMRQHPHELSGGQRQRVLLAMALIREPGFIVADEPTTALDAGSQLQVLRLLRSRCDSAQLAVLMVTHDLSVAAAIADRIAVMYAGQSVEEGRAEQLLAAPAQPYTRALLACTPVVGPDGGAVLPVPIAGTMRSRFATDVGCAFADRCQLVEPRCRVGNVPLGLRVDGRNCRCLVQ